MSGLPTIALATLIGVVLGGFYYGGLWCTVRTLPHTNRFVALYVGSLALRLAFALLAFYWVVQSLGLPGLVACLGGFVGVRILLAYFLGTDDVVGDAGSLA